MPPSKTDLEKLYLEKGLSARQIAAKLGVSHNTVLRWLRTAEIARRPSGYQRHGPTPTAADLERLVHVEHLTYREIAALYSADLTAVPYWLDKHGIERPKWHVARFRGNPPTLSTAEAVQRYAAGESAASIARSAGYKSKTTVLRMLNAAGVTRRPDGWNRERLISDSGCPVRSTYELRVANWLTHHRVPFEYEPDIGLGHGNTRADFFANGWYIEVWGVHSVPSYAAQKLRKQRFYRENGLPLIELSPHHFARDKHILEQRLRQTLKIAEHPAPVLD